MADFTMPSLGADMDAGKLIEWRVGVGDRVERGDIVAVVETNKGLIDIEIWQAGVIDALLVQPGMEVPVGTVLAVLRESASSPRTPLPSAPSAPSAPPPSGPLPELSPTLPAVPGKRARAPATPSARHLARELDVDLETCHGTGPNGAITRDDVTRAAAGRAVEPAPAPGATALAPAAQALRAPFASGMRQAISAAMARSKREIPHYYLALDCDVSRALDWLETSN